MTVAPSDVSPDSPTVPPISRGKDGPSRDSIIVKYMPLALKLGLRYFVDGHEREDLQGEALLALVKAVDRYLETGETVPLGGYLRNKIRTHLHNFWQASENAHALPQTNEHAAITNATAPLREREPLPPDVRQHIEALPPGQRRVIEMDLEDIGDREIASRENISTGAVRATRHKAIKNLKKSASER